MESRQNERCPGILANLVRTTIIFITILANNVTERVAYDSSMSPRVPWAVRVVEIRLVVEIVPKTTGRVISAGLFGDVLY